MSGNTIWLLTIENKHGTDNTAHITYAGAERAVHQYVGDWWDEEFGRQHDPVPEMPEDPVEAIRTYFDEVDDEFFYIQQIPVLP